MATRESLATRVLCLAGILFLGGCASHTKIAIAHPPPPPPPRQQQQQQQQQLSLPPGIKGYREIFYATDRTHIATGTFDGTQSTEEKISYGRSVVSIPSGHVTGELERPWSFWVVQIPEDPAKDIVIARREDIASGPEFFKQINAGIDGSPEHSALVFIHGFNVLFDEAVLRTGQLAWDLGFKGPAILYSWPSAGSVGKYVADFETVEWSAPHLRNFLQDLRRQTGARVVHLIGHSMGTRLLAMALESLPDPKPRFQQIVLAAPDISAALFKQLAPAMMSEAERVTIYSSQRDMALELSGLIGKGPARVGAQARAIPGIDVIDATSVRTSLLGHSYFAESPLILSDLTQLLLGHLAPSQRTSTLQMSGTQIWTTR
jgi:esterase/lipase superfamily enzyme